MTAFNTIAARLNGASIRGSLVAFVFFCVAFGVGAAPAVAVPEGEVKWSVSAEMHDDEQPRSNYNYQLDPGEEVADALVISNLSEVRISLAVYGTDAVTTKEGTLDLLPRSEPATGSGTWISFEQDQIDVEPGATQTVPFTVKVPHDSRPGDHSAGVVTSLIGENANGAVTVDRRLGLRMHTRVSGELTNSAEVRDVRAEYIAGSGVLSEGKVRISYTIVNTGNTRLTGVDTVQVAGLAGIGKRTQQGYDLDEIIVDGELTREVIVDKVFPAMRVSAKVTFLPVSVGIDSQTGSATHGETSTWAIPWVVLAVLLIVLTVVLVLLVRPKLVRKQQERSKPLASSSAQKPLAEKLKPLTDDQIETPEVSIETTTENSRKVSE